MRKNSYRTMLILLSVMFFSIMISSCEKKTTEVDDTPELQKEAAMVIAGNVAYQTGGMVDQIADLCAFVTPTGLDKLSDKYSNKDFIFTRTYNDTTGVWSIHIERERGIPDSIPYAYILRDYTLQYLNSNGIAQRHYIEAGDTARTVHFNVINGFGRHKTRRISQQLNQLTAQWTITNANLPNVTINGNYYRAAVDTLQNNNRTRISDHTLLLDAQDIVAPRGQHIGFANAISGTLTGHFHADITIISGTDTSQRIIDRDINVVFGGGRSNININGTVYDASLATGELIE